MFYDHAKLQTIRGFALEQEGRVLAIGGLMYSSPLQAFSNMTEEAAAYPKMLVKLGRRVCRIFDECQTPVLALPDKQHPNAARFLQRMGFVPLREEIYIWHKPHHS